MKIQQSEEVELVGRGKIRVSAGDYVASGGQGSVYRKGETMIKLYTDPHDIERDGLVARVERLTVFDHPSVYGPNGMVLDRRGKPIGLYGTFAEGEPLTVVFTNDFWTQHSFDRELASTVAFRQWEVFRMAHEQNAFLVDANQENWVVEVRPNDPLPKVFDVESWVFADSIPNTVPKMPSIADYFNANVSLASDWFAWAVITFQLYTGLHPYRGTLDGYKRTEIERRMRDRASVFTPGIRLNSAIRDFQSIPPKLLGWYEGVFQSDERSEPPSPKDTGTALPVAAAVKRIVVTAKDTLHYEKLLEGANDPTVRVFPCGVVLRRSGALYDLGSKQLIGKATNHGCEVVRRDSGWIVAEMVSGAPAFSLIRMRDKQQEPISFSLAGFGIFRGGEQLYLITEKGLTSLKIHSFGAKTIIATDQTLGARVNSTKWFDGVGIQDELGAMYIIATFGESMGRQVRVKELDGLTPISAKAGPRFVSIMCIDAQGEYQKIELTFTRDYSSYALWQAAAETADLNMIVLPKAGGSACVTAGVQVDGELFIFVPTSGELKKVEDRKISTNMILARWDENVVYLHDGNVWSVRM